MERIGEQLKRVREQKGISLQEAADQTKIRRRYLWALEEEDYGAFPAEIYLMGFMRRYAEFLNIDADVILGQYKHEKEKEKGEVQERMLLEQGKRQQGMKKRYTFSVSILAILILIFVGTRLIVDREVSKDIDGDKQIERKVNHLPAKMDIEIKARDKCWLRINIDDKESFEGLLFGGENRKWSGKRIVRIRVGYVPGLEILLNGKVVDIIKGSRGDVNELIFTMQRDGKVNITQKKPLKVVPYVDYFKEELIIDGEERGEIIENEPGE